MPLTREEREVIEDIINKSFKLDERITQLEKDVTSLLAFAAQAKAIGNFLNFSTAEIKDFIESAVKEIIDELEVKQHTHETDKEGGPAFAKKGANLIEEEAE